MDRDQPDGHPQQPPNLSKHHSWPQAVVDTIGCRKTQEVRPDVATLQAG